jgi:hypothetical protein
MSVDREEQLHHVGQVQGQLRRLEGPGRHREDRQRPDEPDVTVMLPQRHSCARRHDHSVRCRARTYSCTRRRASTRRPWRGGWCCQYWSWDRGLGYVAATRDHVGLIGRMGSGPHVTLLDA